MPSESAIRRMLRDGAPVRCPGCDGREAVRFGRTARGTQRYRCDGCGRTFVPEGPLSGSKLPEDIWMTYAGCHARGVPVREAATECGVTVATAYRMRHLVDEMIEAYASGADAL